MADPTEEFFDGLGRRGRDPLLAKVVGTVRFDLTHDQQIDHFFVSMDQGAVRISHEDRPADGVLRTDHALFDRISRGEVNPIAALLRGALSFDGRLPLLVVFSRLLPGPAGAQDPRDLAAKARQLR